jgi:ATP-dependent Clp protease ATP-binding subunit ClpA
MRSQWSNCFATGSARLTHLLAGQCFGLRTLGDWAVSVPERYWEGGMPFQHAGVFGHTAKRCLFFASYEAISFSHSEIALEHLLLGILRQEPSLVPEKGRESVVRAIEAIEPTGRRRMAVAKDLRLSRETGRAVTAAKEIAHDAGRREIAPRDLMAGILREPNTLAARLLREQLADPS